MSRDMLPPPTVKVKAIDVVPYRYALWCTVGDERRQFANDIVHRKWSEDGQTIWFGLDSHTFYSASPDEELELVEVARPCVPKDQESNEQFLAKRPVAKAACPTCGRSGT